MERYLARSTKYSKIMKKILRQNGLPDDLIYIAMIESGFNSKATSHASAVGYWQFIRGTGRRYGLEISSLVDERRDPILSTIAAAEYYKGLYSIFGSWYLAMASYNVGENRVKKEVVKNSTNDFWELARKGKIPKETSNYIPKFIAARLIGHNPEKYGFIDVDYMTPLEFDTIKVNDPINLRRVAEAMSMEYDDLKQLNPRYRGEIAPLKNGLIELRIPVGMQQQAIAAVENSKVKKVEYIADAGETVVHKVRGGESLASIAKKYKTTVAWLREVNDLQAGRRLRVGMRLNVPASSGLVVAKSSQVAALQSKPVGPTVNVESSTSSDKEGSALNAELVTKKGIFYIVQSGDTLSAIANDYNSSVEEIRKMNRMSKKSRLKVGMKLKVPKVEPVPSDINMYGEDSSQRGGARRSIANTAKVKKSVAHLPRVHVVKNGENLSSIAEKYNVELHQIIQKNKISKRSKLFVGAKLLIPAAKAVE